jgi:dipeptide transport system substrate-binding protein
VVFKLKAPLAPLLPSLSVQPFSIVSAEYAAALQKEGKPGLLDQEPIGTGPFSFVSYQKDAVIRFRAFKDFWGKQVQPDRVAKVDNLVFSITPDPSVRYAKLRTNECQIARYPNPADLPAMRANPDIKVQEADISAYNYVRFRMDKKPFDDKRVRTALKLAYDRPTLIKSVFLGEAQQGSDQPISPVVPDIWGRIPVPKYDTARAKQLLAEAGYPNGIDVNLTTSTIAAGAVDVAVAYQQYAAPAGIRVKVNQVPASGYYYNLDALKWDFFVEPWNMRPEEFLFFIEYAPRGGVIPPTRWAPPQFMEMLTAARAATNDRDRMTKFAALERFVADDGPSIVPVYVNVIDAHSNNVIGYQGNPIATNREFWKLALGG